MKTREGTFRGLGIAALLGASALGGMRLSHQTALAQVRPAPPGGGGGTAASCSWPKIGVLIPDLGIGFAPGSNNAVPAMQATGFKLSVGHAASTGIGGGSKIIAGPLILTRGVDRYDPILFGASADGKSLSKVDIQMYDAGWHPCHDTVLGGVTIASIDQSIVTTPQPHLEDSIVLQFSRITMTDGGNNWSYSTPPGK